MLLVLAVGAVRVLGGRGGLPATTAETGPASTTTLPVRREDAAVPSSAGDPTAEKVRAILAGVNAARKDAHLAPVTLEDRLGATALALSADLAASGRCSHDDGDGNKIEARLHRAGYAPLAYGEVLACGSRSAAEALGQWRQSAAHRKIMLDPRFHEAGVGIALEGRDGPVWVVTFGAER